VRDAFAMKRDWLRRRGLFSSVIESAATQDCLLDLAARAPSSIDAHVDALCRDGKAVAVGVTFACKGSGVGYLLSHDPDCEKQGAGALLAEHVMKTCFLRKYAGFDMLAPHDAYKSEWADGAVTVADFTVGFTPRGRLFAAAWRRPARRRLKQALNRMPPGLGRIVWPLARKILRR
jgi:CelD/BcsL family acetyltransferase involved in cellulose biosynthesis